jgi:DNA-binding transcriptional regulator YiaG
MSTIATVLKQEIARLARKEVKALTDSTKKASAQHRRDIAKLKREVSTLTRQVAFLERQEKSRATARASKAEAEGRRFSARGLRSHRERLGLSANDLAQLVGVSSQTIYNWERGVSRPRAEQLAALVKVRALGKREALKRLELLES